ncbi:hypothetical protein SpCBS45565_g05496 [Spizellomyces sp. 'palustris']|nr:hypothetical protein SpCBS45565_g05496 [Spizellomyces sp. 'palustris']
MFNDLFYTFIFSFLFYLGSAQSPGAMSSPKNFFSGLYTPLAHTDLFKNSSTAIQNGVTCQKYGSEGDLECGLQCSQSILMTPYMLPSLDPGLGPAIQTLSILFPATPGCEATCPKPLFEPLEGINQTGFVVADGNSMVAVRVKDGQFWVDFVGEDRLACAGIYKRQDWV